MAVTSALTCFAEDPAELPTYPEIPYYLRHLQETTLEGKRFEYNKIIHTAVVTSDLTSKKVVKEMEPIIDKIRIAMDSGLDRPYLDQSMWLATAVDYFEREKLKPVVDIPESDWAKPQNQLADGSQLFTFPDRIVLQKGSNPIVIAQSSDIHEAVISPNGKYAAFSRRKDTTSKAEIWIVNVKKRTRVKATTAPSCYTLLFSLDGDNLFLQEVPAKASEESTIHVVDSGGGKIKPILKGRLLDTLVEKGKYKGSIIVFKKTRHHLGTTDQDCAYAFTEGGKEVGRLKQGPCR